VGGDVVDSSVRCSIDTEHSDKTRPVSNLTPEPFVFVSFAKGATEKPH
jgi:hypothetical protein